MSNADYFNLFTQLLLKTCAVIEGQYFIVDQSNGQSRYRERVYGYELYHRLRQSLQDDPRLKHLSLNGELDKAGRPDFSNEKPDIVLHAQGSMDHNIAIIEIKRHIGTDFESAIDNLNIFTTKYQYAGGILLVFGGTIKPLEVPEKCLLINHHQVGITPRILRCISHP